MVCPTLDNLHVTLVSLQFHVRSCILLFPFGFLMSYMVLVLLNAILAFVCLKKNLDLAY